ncbi:hypothetical protein PF010_g33219 [Phytophthora fragariae]|uniref:Uncharacterized protein n=1 Tax=Phytophthora fragariae TaxID=53985 RepID=A0A6A4ANU0_9STRA|nr:hypothetical protein PF009_g31460 [Phytophthora fragariae]KAE9047651.1 hypothetical protein PF010_g33219 [Phytophthora fragariae]KAE9055144.1 hypothetical protein PF007_g32408 [Phytophthora fragariae]KAE9260316.1 hypothetical protein PF001_g32751 [Phytophthora fragariae]
MCFALNVCLHVAVSVSSELRQLTSWVTPYPKKVCVLTSATHMPLSIIQLPLQSSSYKVSWG